jgi:hypothetical protein
MINHLSSIVQICGLILLGNNIVNHNNDGRRTSSRMMMMKMPSSESPHPQPEYAVLHSATTSLVVEVPVDGTVPLWRYWGPRLPDHLERPPLSLRAERAVAPPTFSLDNVVPFSVCPTFGCGWFGQSALRHTDQTVAISHTILPTVRSSTHHRRSRRSPHPRH